MGSQPVGIPRVLESLPARPPTPPREAIHEVDAALPRQLLVSQVVHPRTSLHTPPNVYSPNPASSSTSRRKKVGFSAQAEYKEPPVYTEALVGKHQPTPVSLPSSSSRPVKSILKATTLANPLESVPNSQFDGSTPDQFNIAAMLESTIQQLAGADALSKLNAYRTLVEGLRASNNLPDRIALQDRMSLFTQFIQRDITAKTAAGSPDTQLIIAALTLLNTFLHFPGIASTLPNDFGIFIVDHCIRSFEDGQTSKEIARHLMQLVRSQNFSPKVMTSDRVGRLVTSLNKIEQHLQGKSILMYRICIYQRLVKQCRQQMITHSDWMLDMFTDMLSTMKEIRSAAIGLGLEAAFNLGREKTVTKKVTEILKFSRGEEKKKYIDFYAERLTEMANDDTERLAVPRIWSVMILFLADSDKKWSVLVPWMTIMQACFNGRDFQVRREANHAWCRLVYRLEVDDRCLSAKSLNILIRPLIQQLERKWTGKHPEELRKVLMGCICNLFYYTFDPTGNPAMLDTYWDRCLKVLMEQFLDRKKDRAQDNMIQAALILTGLFDHSRTRTWKDDHVLENPLVKPDELPAIDAKWIRRNAARVFTIVGPILETNFLELSNVESPFCKLWQALIGAVAGAGKQEVMVSSETMTFMAHSFDLLVKIWSKGPGSSEDRGRGLSAKFLESTRHFLKTMIESPRLPFTEKVFLINKQDGIKAVSTPQHRPGKNQGSACSPLYHLFSILSSIPPGVVDDDTFAVFIGNVFAGFFEKGRADLPQELLQSLPMDALCAYGPWVAVSERILSGWDHGQHSHQTTSSGSEAPVGHEYRDVAKILERGLRSTPNLPWIHWQKLFNGLCNRVREETGDAGLAIAVVDYLAKSVLELLSSAESPVHSNLLKASVELISVSTQPRDRQAVEAARRRLWGTTLSGPRTASFDPFDTTYKLMTFHLEKMYILFPTFDAEEFTMPLLNAVTSFLGRCNRHLQFRTLVLLQDGIACWIRDGEKQLGNRESSPVVDSIKALWERVCAILTDVNASGELQLENVEALLIAAFESKHRAIVNITSNMWNTLFSNAESVQYPERLRETLISLHPFVDIVLPGLSLSSTEPAAQQPDFLASQGEVNFNLSVTPSEPKMASRPSSRHSASPGPMKLSALKRSIDTTPKSKMPKQGRRSATPKLRHDDSQIQFAAIESSPSILAVNDTEFLTDRQKEVRERQKENAAMFPEIHSSPQGTNKITTAPISSPQLPSAKSPEQRATTPEPARDYEDYITSTPTPRRGQPVELPENDQEMADPPSSPPEPRSFPPLSELKSTRSGSNSVLDEWQFSSSPITGSPVPHQSMALPLPMELDEVNERLQLDDMNEDEKVEVDLGQEQISPNPEVEVDLDNVEESIVPDELPVPKISTKAAKSPRKSSQNQPTTPPRVLRSRTAQETPRSDDDVFMDAPTSPLPPTPKNKNKSGHPVAATNSTTKEPKQSFDMSDADERSLVRIVVQLESKKREPVPMSDAPPVSPQKPDGKEPETLDCITVAAGPTRGRGRGRRSKSRQSSANIPSTPQEDAAVISQTDSMAYGRLRKRKRAAEKMQAIAGGKRRKSQGSQESGDDSVDIPDSQDVPANEDVAMPSSEAFSEPEASTQGSSFEEKHLGLPAIPEHKPAESQDNTDDEAVQSQLALEQSGVDSQMTGKQENLGDGESLDAGLSGAAAEDIQEAIDGSPVRSEPAVQDREVEAVEVTSPPARSKFEEIMSMLQGGLSALRGAELSRDEVYRVEDMFMDMKRELFEAERRGRN